MRSEPLRLGRLLVIIGGITDPGFSACLLSERFDCVTMNPGIVAVGVGHCLTFDDCRERVIEAIQAAYPSQEAQQTAEVDVIGFSMGGVVARYSALPRENAMRLRIARLFTISSPMQGAAAAPWVPALYPVIKSLRPDSTFMTALNAREPDYPVYSYVRLGDSTIGPENAALPGRVPWWVETPFMGISHQGAIFDARIIADIARRLRGEEPLTLEPLMPPPVKKESATGGLPQVS